MKVVCLKMFDKLVLLMMRLLLLIRFYVLIYATLSCL